MDYSTLKLIIWDLDDTFWAGTLTEGGITPLQQNIDIVKLSSKRGIINSICSKNDEEPVSLKLKELGVNDFFVFNSINWESKGARIKSIIEDMGLRSINVLFIDDNPMNLQEAKALSPELNVSEPEMLSSLLEFLHAMPEKDPELKRLSQYKVLEKKRDSKKEFASNEEFLYNSRIIVEIGKDCRNYLDRIADLVIRSNQVNYTKKRSTKEELIALFDDENFDCGYVSVRDNYGDYGIIGFYAIDKKTNNCEHLLFSCRCIGMGVEQYVYAILGYPRVQVKGEVIVSLTDASAPKWINTDVQNNGEKSDADNSSFTILFKGPCDLSTMTKYLEKKCKVIEEFAHVGDNGATIESHNHSLMIRNNYQIDSARIKTILEDFPHLDHSLFETQIYTKKFDVVCISSIVDPNFGLYRKKGTDIVVPFGEAYYPITDSTNWEDYASGKLYFSGYLPSFDYLKEFSEKYEFIGKASPEMFISNLKFIMEKIDPTTRFVIILGIERAYPGCPRSKNWINRHIEHRKYNEAIRSFAEAQPRVRLLDFNDFVDSDNDFLGAINHYKPRVYFAMAQRLTEIINEISGVELLSGISKRELLKKNVDAWIGRIKEILFNNVPLYRKLALWHNQ